VVTRIARSRSAVPKPQEPLTIAPMAKRCHENSPTGIPFARMPFMADTNSSPFITATPRMEMNPTDREVRKMVKARGITYPVAIDKGERIGKRYGLIAHPTTVLIDRAGRVVRLETGFVRGDEKEIEAALKTLLAPKSTEGARQ